ncbi:MAG: peroxide stress protein YaaA [Prolixibacteraceae bacterium]
MIIVISPAKSLDFDSKPNTDQYTQPLFLNEAAKINVYLKKLKPSDLIRIQGISAKLAELNAGRNLKWELPFTTQNAKQAILAFNGDVYEGMHAAAFTEEEMEMAQEKIRILSGLYGLLRPLDLIQPYRLEMGTKIRIGSYRDLYHFWQKKITTAINQELQISGPVLINLASQEYFKAIDRKKIKAQVITPVFMDNKDNQYKIISFFAKKARGLMCRFIITNQISGHEDLKAFDLEGYHFNHRLTSGNEWIFTRER